MSRNDAKSMLVHYMGKAWERAGLKWDSDNISEVEGIVDSIAEVVKDEVHDEFLAADRATDRFDAACAALNGLLAQDADLPKREGENRAQAYARNAVGYADALLAELAKEPQ